VTEDIVTGLWKLLAILGLVLANAFFVAAEFALVSVRQSRMEELARKGIVTARLIQRAIAHLDSYVACAQVGITIASLALGWIAEVAVADQLVPLFSYLPGKTSMIARHAVATALALIIITILHVVLGEQVPKVLALRKPDQTAMVIIHPMVAAFFIFRPLIALLSSLTNGVLRIMHLEPPSVHSRVHSVDELAILVRQSHEAGVIDDMERQMLQRTFRFAELAARDVMIPRLDMVALDISEPLDELLDKAAQTIHTRLPVYEESIDNIIGVLHTQDLFRRVRQGEQNIDVRKLLRPPLIVPESTSLDELLEHFRSHHTQIAIVVDEHGGTEGLVTLEDIIEEVFGELQDMLEAEQPDIQEMPDGRIIVRGDVHLHELEERLEWRLDDEEADTIAGYVMAKLGRTARLGDVVETAFGTIRVENMARLRITQVSLCRKEPSPQDTKEQD